MGPFGENVKSWLASKIFHFIMVLIAAYIPVILMQWVFIKSGASNVHSESMNVGSGRMFNLIYVVFSIPIITVRLGFRITLSIFSLILCVAIAMRDA